MKGKATFVCFVGRPTDSEAKRPILRLTTLDPIAVASGGNSKFEKKGPRSRITMDLEFYCYY